jgi:sporulation protein YqfC
MNDIDFNSARKEIHNKKRALKAQETDNWPKDSAGKISKMTIYNNDEIYIENFRHVIYSDVNKLSVKTKKGILNIYGNNLKMDYYTSYEIKVTGRIDSLDWLTG